MAAQHHQKWRSIHVEYLLKNSRSAATKHRNIHLTSSSSMFAYDTKGRNAAKKSRPAQTFAASLTPWRKPHKKGENPKKDTFYDGVPLSKSDYQKSALFFRMEPALKSLGQRLRLARRALHLSIADTAAKAGVSTETVRRLEKGGAGTSLAVLYSILFVLGREKDFENLVVLSFEDGYMINNKLFTKDEEKEITDMLEKC